MDLNVISSIINKLPSTSDNDLCVYVCVCCMLYFGSNLIIKSNRLEVSSMVSRGSLEEQLRRS